MKIVELIARAARYFALRGRTRRTLGIWRGRIWTAEDFDAPLADDDLAAREGT